MLTKHETDGDIQGIRIGRTAPPISHLFFTDDILIFCKASVDQTTKVINRLEKLCSWTGQSFNPMESGCFFLNNIHGSLKAAIKSSLDMKEMDRVAIYLRNNFFPSNQERMILISSKGKFLMALKGGRRNFFLK